VAADPGSTHYWISDGDTIASGDGPISIFPEHQTMYYCIASHSNCSADDSVFISVFTTPVFEFPETASICNGDEYIFDPGIDAQYFMWSDNYIDIPRSAREEGMYSLKASNGPCSWSDSCFLDVIYADVLDLPNVFTPNGDGFNDRFETRTESPEDFIIHIYDRWGKQVFESTDPNTTWDGTIGKEKASEGVYFYTCTYKSQCNEKVLEMQGTVELLR
jgi:gliding motility-associated-like protein